MNFFAFTHICVSLYSMYTIIIIGYIKCVNTEFCKKNASFYSGVRLKFNYILINVVSCVLCFLTGAGTDLREHK